MICWVLKIISIWDIFVLVCSMLYYNERTTIDFNLFSIFNFLNRFDFQNDDFASWHTNFHKIKIVETYNNKYFYLKFNIDIKETIRITLKNTLSFRNDNYTIMKFKVANDFNLFSIRILKINNECHIESNDENRVKSHFENRIENILKITLKVTLKQTLKIILKQTLRIALKITLKIALRIVMRNILKKTLRITLRIILRIVLKNENEWILQTWIVI